MQAKPIIPPVFPTESSEVDASASSAQTTVLETLSSIRSMTGYGRAVGELEGIGKLTVEVKSVNGKGAELSVKLPKRFVAQEFALRQRLIARLGRGTAQVWVGLEEGPRVAQMNEAAVEAYFTQINALSERLGIPKSPMIMDTLLGLPEVFVRTSGEEVVVAPVIEGADNAKASDPAWEAAQGIIEQAWAEFEAFRAAEGLQTALALVHSLGEIEHRRALVAELAPQRVPLVRERLEKALRLAEEVRETQPDSNRLEQELLYYMERTDIAEELQRLGQHLTFFRETLESGPAANGEASEHGRKLGFIAQEIGRELNTLGAKSYDAAMQAHMVEAKHSLEKIKEQVLNVL